MRHRLPVVTLKQEELVTTAKMTDILSISAPRKGWTDMRGGLSEDGISKLMNQALDVLGFMTRG